MTQGVCYFLCGGGKRQKWRRYLSMLTVSLYTLRRRYDGAVCVLVGEDTANDNLLLNILKACRHGSHLLGDYRHVPITAGVRHSAYVTKASLWRHSPYDQTILLDADTLVTGDITPLFDAPLTVTSFAEWMTTGKIVGGRLKQWRERGIQVERVNGLMQFSERALNTGVVAWDRSTAGPELESWERLTREGHECSFTDELAMQILWPDFAAHGCRMVDDRWNCSPSFGVNRDVAKVWHYHGRRMAPGRGKPDCAAMYRPHLLSAIGANAGGIREWLQEVDPALWELAQ